MFVCVCVCVREREREKERVRERVCVCERERTAVTNSGLCNAKCRDCKNKELDRAGNRVMLVYLGYKHLS